MLKHLYSNPLSEIPVDDKIEIIYKPFEQYINDKNKCRNAFFIVSQFIIWIASIEDNAVLEVI